MGKSILQARRECYVTGTTTNLHKHHIYGGARRRLSEEHGCWVYLRGDYHNQSNLGVHCGNSQLDHRLKRNCQKAFEAEHSREDFVRIFGRNYL